MNSRADSSSDLIRNKAGAALVHFFFIKRVKINSMRSFDASNHKSPGRVTMTENAEIILEVLKTSGKPMRPGDIAKEAGLEKDEVSKLIKKMKTNGTLCSPKRCFYALPE